MAVPVAGLDSVALSLDDPAARDPQVAGAKAAALAKARGAGLPALDGFVITTMAMALEPSGLPTEEIRRAWDAVSGGGARALVVRSSSALEDTEASSMAGRFTTVVGVTGWDHFLAAVTAVRGSAEFVARTEGLRIDEVPIAVLVQPLLVPRAGGVMFGIDPVTGRSDRVVIAAVHGLPEHLVSGTQTGSRYEIDATGRRHAYTPGPDAVHLPRRTRRRLVQLGAECAALFGGPQDIEWAVGPGGDVTLLQSRPVTTSIAGIPEGPTYGSGPTSETFPDPLAPLEVDLWAEPLKRALHTVFDVLGVVPPARLERTPLLIVVRGRIAVDLDVFEASQSAGGHSVARRIRALRAAWRIGRLRAALPSLAADELRVADEALLDVPPAATLTERQLVAALGSFSKALESLHTYEMLVGLVLRPASARSGAQSVALRVLDRARAEGLADVEIPARFPITLALAPPRVGPGIRLPRQFSIPEWVPGPEDAASTAREALRLRVRWTQEVGSRFAWELGVRLTDRGLLADPQDLRRLRLDELESVVRGRSVLLADASTAPDVDSPALPARFRLSDRGLPVPVTPRHPRQGIGAGGGRGSGPVCLAPDDPPDGAVLVVRALDARLAPVLPRLGGLVAETGSVLAHLAILARELGIPTVVGLPDATSRWSEGTPVEVDGITGTVRSVVHHGNAADGQGAA